SAGHPGRGPGAVGGGTRPGWGPGGETRGERRRRPPPLRDRSDQRTAAAARTTRIPAATASVRPRRARGGGPPPTAWTLSKEPDARWLDEPLLRRFRSVIEAGLFPGIPGAPIAPPFHCPPPPPPPHA